MRNLILVVTILVLGSPVIAQTAPPPFPGKYNIINRETGMEYTMQVDEFGKAKILPYEPMSIAVPPQQPQSMLQQ